jgi:hypothetical protein
MVGASDDYLDRFINELPRTFNPTRFDADEWARQAKVAGMKYVVFTTKHHSGFCMFETETTDFNIMNTPYGQDITRQIVDAFRRWGIAIGFYFSPDDFWLLHKQGTTVSRARPEVNPLNNPELMAHNKAQVTELLTNYGFIDMMFYDGEASRAQATDLGTLATDAGHPRRHGHAGAAHPGQPAARAVGGQLHAGHPVGLQADPRDTTSRAPSSSRC